MKILLFAFVLLVAVPCVASTNTVDCPKGTTPNGETTPETSEAWCEISRNGETVQHGPYRSWWPNGKLGAAGQFDYGEAVGHWRGWYETGELQSEEWFENGMKVKARYFDREGREIEGPEE